jgi:hypothetical protein
MAVFNERCFLRSRGEDGGAHHMRGVEWSGVEEWSRGVESSGGRATE